MIIFFAGDESMAMIKCPECGRQISDKAVNCPICGYPIKSGSTNNKINLSSVQIFLCKSSMGEQKVTISSPNGVLWQGKSGSTANLNLNYTTTITVKYHQTLMKVGGAFKCIIDPTVTNRYRIDIGSRSINTGGYSTEYLVFSLEPLPVYDGSVKSETTNYNESLKNAVMWQKSHTVKNMDWNEAEFRRIYAQEIKAEENRLKSLGKDPDNATENIIKRVENLKEKGLEEHRKAPQNDNSIKAKEKQHNNKNNDSLMMFCSWCGKKIPRDSIYCAYCGKKITFHT